MGGENHMKTKRCLTMLLCLLLCLGLFPLPALATGERYLEIDGTNFPDEHFRQWVTDNLAGGKDYMTKDEVDAVTVVDVRSKNIEDLTGIERFPALKELYCLANKLTALDVSKNTALEYLNCYSNKIPALDVSKNTALKHLDCGSNTIEKLDVSSLSGLEYLNCYLNELTSLDVSKNAALQALFCQMNKLTALDLSHNTGLTRLDISSNPFSAPVDISKLTALQHLGCYHLDLTELDLSNSPQLTDLECYKNQLTVLDLSHNPLLQKIQCQRNQLSALDVSKCPDLNTLNCEDNRLSALDVSKNAKLVWFNCGNNQLTALDVSQNAILKSLSCKNNQLSALDLSQNAALERFWCGGNRLASLDLSKNTQIQSTYFDLGTQEIPNQTLTKKDGAYTYDFGARVADKTKVTVTGDGVTYDSATGVITMSKAYDRCTYRYATGRGDLEVTLRFQNGTVDPDAIYVTFKTQPKSVTVKAGNKATFKVKVKQKGVTYQWYSRYSETDDWKPIGGATEASLTVVGVTGNSGSQYRCGVTNEGKEVFSKAATMTVTPVKPKIKTQPKTAKVKSGATVKFTVKATGPHLQYQWYKCAPGIDDWQKIPDATSDTYSFVAAKTDNDWLYRCEVKNEDGSVMSKIVKVSVKLSLPKFSTHPKSAKVKSGTVVMLKVKVKGEGVTYQWYVCTSKEGTWEKIDGATSATYSVTVTAANNGYQYRCEARNADGASFSRAATLKLK